MKDKAKQHLSFFSNLCALADRGKKATYPSHSLKVGLDMKDTLRDLLRGNPAPLQEWMKDPSSGRMILCLILIFLGCGLYGATVGYWRSPLMGAYVALKMPALIFLTLTCNGFLNGVFGLLLGSGLGFRQSLLALLMSFTVMSLILGSLAPVTFFIAHNAPTVDSPDARSAHASYLLTHTVLIAYAGVVANLHLYRFLKDHCPTPQIALSSLAAWLAGNAFVGAQLSWILRPFFGSPELEVEFLREDAMEGTFYGAVSRSLSTIFLPKEGLSLDQYFLLIFTGCALFFLAILTLFARKKTRTSPQNKNQ